MLIIICIIIVKLQKVLYNRNDPGKEKKLR